MEVVDGAESGHGLASSDPEECYVKSLNLEFRLVITPQIVY